MTMVSQSRPPAGSPISPRSSLDRILPRRDVTAAGVITCGIARRSPFRHLAELLSDSRGALRLGGLIEGSSYRADLGSSRTCMRARGGEQRRRHHGHGESFHAHSAQASIVMGNVLPSTTSGSGRLVLIARPCTAPR